VVFSRPVVAEGGEEEEEGGGMGVDTRRGAEAPETLSRQACRKQGAEIMARERKERQAAQKAKARPGTDEVEGVPLSFKAFMTPEKVLKYVLVQKIIMRKVSAFKFMLASRANTRLAPASPLTAALALNVA
jgi:hypothetical protein